MSRNDHSNQTEAAIDDGADSPEETSTIDLPGEDVHPEGVALWAEENLLFVSGAKSGAIYRGDPDAGRMDVFVSGENREPLTTIGLDVDGSGRLWVAGGASGDVFVFDARTGDLQDTLSTPAATDTFLNDLVVGTAGEVYVTDSLRTVLFRVEAGSRRVEPWLDLAGGPLESRAKGSDANGIVITPDGAYLIVVKTGTGQLFRVDTHDGRILEIDLAGEDVAGGDGLVLDGPLLYVVRNAAHEVSVIELGADHLSGRIVSRITDPSFEFPTTAAKAGDRLLVVNSQFDTMGAGGARLPFRVSRVAIPAK